MLFDTHCHPNLAKNKDKDLIIKNFQETNPEGFLNIIGTNPETNKDILKISQKYKSVYCSIGIHPCDIYELDLEKTILELENHILKNKEKIVAIGECGLDYYWLKPENDKIIAKYNEEHQNKIIKEKKELQKLFFKAQILLAKEYKLPLIIHNRESKDNILDILKEMDFKNFIFHCYSEDLNYAKRLIEFAPECKISFSGIVTFKNAKDIQDTAKNIDIKHILAETDSPYLTPTPLRGKEENEPAFTKYVVEKINELKGVNCSNEIFKNSLEIFGLSRFYTYNSDFPK